MPVTNWTEDPPGIFKNHKISDALLETSTGETVMLPFTQEVEGGLGAHAGQTVNIPSVNRLPVRSNPRLAEDDEFPIDKLTWNTRAITVTEFGSGVEATNLMMLLNVFNTKNVLQKALMRQMEESLDSAVGLAFRDPASVKICFIPTSATGGVFDTDGTPSTVAASALTYAHIGVLADYLAGDIHCPPVSGTNGNYVMLGTRKLLRGLKDDDKSTAVGLYLRQGDLFFKGELFMIENIRFVQVDRESALPNSAGSSTVLGNGLLFGDEAMARVEADTPHLRMDPNYQSRFGTRQAAAWYGVLEYGSFWDSADDGRAKIIRITSA